MKLSSIVRAFCAGVVVCSLAARSEATFDLQVTEIWSGNEAGTDVTPDWFEVTNLGDMAWEAAVHGALYFDDDSADASVADLIHDPLDVMDPPVTPFAKIDPGQSVIFVDGSATDFFNAWNPTIPVAMFPTIGEYDGSGLSGGGDGVALFLDDEMDGVDAGDLLSLSLYPDTDGFFGRSYDSNAGRFSPAGFGGILSLPPKRWRGNHNRFARFRSGSCRAA